MLKRFQKLIGHPGFKADPLGVLWRGAVWAGCVATRRAPVFHLTEGGERIQVPPTMRYTSVATYLLRDWTEPELRELNRFIGPGDIFVDVGANIGLYTLKAARIVGQGGRVLAVEPGASAAASLAHNLALNPFANVTVAQKALSSEDGWATLHHVPLGNDPQAFSLLAGAGTSEGEKVETITLDRLATEAGLARIDCIKIDVEGAEPMVLRGALAVVERWQPTVILEVNCPTGTVGGTPPDAAWNILAERGYRFSRLQDGQEKAIDRLPADFCNVVARHPARAR